jgi:hypothetical protein
MVLDLSKSASVYHLHFVIKIANTECNLAIAIGIDHVHVLCKRDCLYNVEHIVVFDSALMLYKCSYPMKGKFR